MLLALRFCATVWRTTNNEADGQHFSVFTVLFNLRMTLSAKYALHGPFGNWIKYVDHDKVWWSFYA